MNWLKIRIIYRKKDYNYEKNHHSVPLATWIVRLATSGQMTKRSESTGQKTRVVTALNSIINWCFPLVVLSFNISTVLNEKFNKIRIP